MPPLELIRYVVFAVFVASAIIAIAAWAVRTRQVSPFSPLGRVLRSLSEPFVRPMEHWMVKRGGNPQNAGLWIFGIALVGGIVVMVIATWVAQQVVTVGNGIGSGRGMVRLGVYYTGQVLMLALLIRVIASWVGQFRFSPWLRPVYFLTDWMIRPLQKIIPPMGMFDFTPLIAWFLLRILVNLIMSAI